MRLCLNMIVRDERAILERCLRSVRPHLDYYVICDTGSTDGTVDLIREVMAGVPGEVHLIPFQDFEQARNEALERCRASAGSFDYLLLIDADMELVAEGDGWRQGLSQPAYMLRQASGGFSYHNVRLLARGARARYVGATHEYLELEGPVGRLEGVHMLDHACGSSRSVKWERDLALLGAALERDPGNPRTAFYLAQTLREAGRPAEALALYERRIALGGWEEEVWYARFMRARCHRDLGDEAAFVAACLEAYDSRPTRAEPLHALAVHYRHAGRNEACSMLCEEGLRIPLPEDLLFLDEEVYRTGFRHELSITGYYSKDPLRRARARRSCAELSTERPAPAGVRATARANWRFYARGAAELFPSARFRPLELTPPEGTRTCNPSLAVREGEIWGVARHVNYLVVDGCYHVEGDGVIRTRSELFELGADLRPRRSVPLQEPAEGCLEGAPIVGLEDIRLACCGGSFRGSGTVADRDPSWRRRMAVFDVAEDGRVSGFTLQEHEDREHQKNWMPFVDGEGLGFVYWTDPTVVLRFDEERRQARPWRSHVPALALDHQRGGSGLAPFDGGWLAVTHELSMLGNRRVYLHRFVAFDAGFRVRAVSEPFWFRGLGIEFASGLVAGPARGLEEDQLLVSFGVEDREAWLLVVEAGDVRRWLG